MTTDVPVVRRVLFDSSVLRCGHVARPMKLTTTTQDGWAFSRGFMKRPANDPWKQRQIERLPTIARLVIDGKIEGFSSWELGLEYRGVWEEPRIGNSFADVPLKIARVPIYRDRLGTSRFNRRELEIHCRKLLRLTPKQAEQYIIECGELMSMDEFEKASFLDIKKFHNICHADNHESHLRDAYHLWTAERNGIDYFCMIEKRFPNYVRGQCNTGRIQLRCQIVTPEELLDRLRVTELLPLPLRDGWFYHWGGGEEEVDPPSRIRRRWRSLIRSIWSVSPD